jgi:NAD(P)-dependent dehydrogenase (short-subunit alcohol dehydrogenase family)
MGRLEDRVALVTGAGQGIGEAIARELAREGAWVGVIDIRRETAEQVAESLGGSARALVFDITDADAYSRAVEEVLAERGRIDILVNNAAVAFVAGVFEDTREQWDRTLEVNLEAMHWGAKLVAPAMARRGWGRIVNITSVHAYATDGRVGAYCASKGGIVALTQALAVELAPHGILVNAIAPGFVRTAMSMVDGVDETTTGEFAEWYVKRRKVPLARAAEPREIARAAVFLASEDCSYVTGATLVADGGLTITF